MGTTIVDGWAVAAPTKKRGSSDTPSAEVPAMDAEVDRYLQLKAWMEDAQAELKLIQERMTFTAETLLDAAIQSSGKQHSSIKLCGDRLRFERAGRPVAVAPDVAERLSTLLGREDIFTRKTTLTIPLELVDADLKSKLVALGVAPTFETKANALYFTLLNDPEFRSKAYSDPSAPKPQCCFKRPAKKE